MKLRPAGNKAIDRPADQTEQSQLFAARRIHSQPIRVVGVALCAAHLLGVAVVPDCALAQEPVRREPAAGEDDRRPPRVAEEHCGRGQTTDHFHESAGNKVQSVGQRRTGHTEIEVARRREVGSQTGILEVSHPREAHARVREPVVEPGCSPVAKVVADRGLERSQNLQQDEHDTREGERADEAVAILHGSHEHAHRHGEDRRQNAAKQHDEPPHEREAAVRLWQRRKELPLVALTKPFQHRLPSGGSERTRLLRPTERDSLRTLCRWINSGELRIAELLANEARRVGRGVGDAPPKSRIGVP